MNAVSRQTMEELIGIRMAALAKAEGHIPAPPKMVEKVPQNPERNHANTLIGIKNRKRVLTAIRRGVRTCPHIAQVLSIPDGSARKACRELEKEGKIKRQGFTTLNNSQTTLWSIVTP